MGWSWDWVKQEWGTQAPKIRWEIYKWGTVALLGLLYLKVRSLLSHFPDFPPWASDAISLVVLILLISLIFKKLGPRAVSNSDAVVSSEAKQSPNKGMIVVLVIAVVGLSIWNFVLQHRVRILGIEMTRYALPRGLTQEQITDFGNYLAKNSQSQEVKIKYVLGDSEVSKYASDISLAFRAGHWLATAVPLNPWAMSCQPVTTDKPIPTCVSEAQQMMNRSEGLYVEQSGPNPPPPATIEGKINPPPSLDAIVGKAFEAAHVSGVPTGYGFSNDPLNTITVFVGTRKRDKWAVLPKNARDLMMKNRDIEDSDF